eukprot:448163_1
MNATGHDALLDVLQKKRITFYKLLDEKSTFKKGKTVQTEHTIDDQKVNIDLQLTYCNIKTQPRVWCIETIVPGSPLTFYEHWNDKRKLKFDQTCRYFKCKTLIERNDEDLSSPWLTISETVSKRIGIISPRSMIMLVDMRAVGDDGSMESIGQSIESKDFPKRKGVVTGNFVLLGSICKVMDEKEAKETYHVPCTINNGSTSLQWYKMTVMVQLDSEGWLPKVMLNHKMSQTLIDMYTALTFELFKYVGAYNESNAHHILR